MNNIQKRAHIKTAKIFGLIALIILAFAGLAFLMGEHAPILIPVAAFCYVLYSAYKVVYNEQLKKIKREDW